MGLEEKEISGPRTVIEQGNGLYPAGLCELEKPPECLYVIGDPTVLSRESVAIVGARKATPYGLACARLAADVACEMGLCVISGAAYGCDQAAQRETLRLGGTTVAVMGSGADVVYPPGAADMFADIVDSGGAILSAAPWGTPPKRWTFIHRNDIMAALAGAVVVCEAGMPSGTFRTAETAALLGKELDIFPGSIFSPNSQGSNYLLSMADGAIPLWDRTSVEVCFSRVFTRLRHPESTSGKHDPWASFPANERFVLRALEAQHMLPGELAESLSTEVIHVMRYLGSLEQRGLVMRLLDGRYSLSEEAFLRQNISGAI